MHPSSNWRMANRLAGGDLDNVLRGYVTARLSGPQIVSALLDDYGIEASLPTAAKWVDAAQSAAGYEAAS